ncbi:hypothetical protein BaRGS_00021032, partial [Batillaria attramentaria]
VRRPLSFGEGMKLRLSLPAILSIEYTAAGCHKPFALSEDSKIAEPPAATEKAAAEGDDCSGTVSSPEDADRTDKSADDLEKVIPKESSGTVISEADTEMSVDPGTVIHAECAISWKPRRIN